MSVLVGSPRSSLRSRLAAALPDGGSFVLDAAAEAVTAALIPADAAGKLRHQKLYLVLDLDETLVYSKRMEAGATPLGTGISVRGQPFDMQPRPGLHHFLQTVVQNFIVFLYTMGDEDYTTAVLRVIDPESKFFRGASACRTATRPQSAPPPLAPFDLSSSPAHRP